MKKRLTLGVIFLIFLTAMIYSFFIIEFNKLENKNIKREITTLKEDISNIKNDNNNYKENITDLKENSSSKLEELETWQKMEEKLNQAL